MLLEEHDEPLRVEFRFREATGRCGAIGGINNFYNFLKLNNVVFTLRHFILTLDTSCKTGTYRDSAMVLSLETIATSTLLYCTYMKSCIDAGSVRRKGKKKEKNSNDL